MVLLFLLFFTFERCLCFFFSPGLREGQGKRRRFVVFAPRYGALFALAVFFPLGAGVGRSSGFGVVGFSLGAARGRGAFSPGPLPFP